MMKTKRMREQRKTCAAISSPERNKTATPTFNHNVMGFAGHSGKRIAGNAGNLKKLLMGFVCIEVMQKVYDTLRHEGELITCPGPCMKKGWVSPALQASQVVVESGCEFETVRGFTGWVYAYLSLVAMEEDSLVEDNMGEKVDTKTFRHYPIVPAVGEFTSWVYACLSLRAMEEDSLQDDNRGQDGSQKEHHRSLKPTLREFQLLKEQPTHHKMFGVIVEAYSGVVHNLADPKGKFYTVDVVQKVGKVKDKSEKEEHLKMHEAHLSTSVSPVYWIAQYGPVYSSPEELLLFVNRFCNPRGQCPIFIH